MADDPLEGGKNPDGPGPEGDKAADGTTEKGSPKRRRTAAAAEPAAPKEPETAQPADVDGDSDRIARLEAAMTSMQEAAASEREKREAAEQALADAEAAREQDRQAHAESLAALRAGHDSEIEALVSDAQQQHVDAAEAAAHRGDRPSTSELDRDIDPDLEVWRNNARGKEQVWRIEIPGSDGPKAELIRGGQRFTISPRERRFNMAKYNSDNVNPYLNGTFTQESYVGTDPESLRVAERADALTDDRIAGLYDGEWATFQMAVAGITNPVVLGHMETYGVDNDKGSRRVDLIRQRIIEVAGRFVEPPTPPEGWRDPDAAGTLNPPQQPDFYGQMPAEQAPIARGF